jgi:hypothetical protein
MMEWLNSNAFFLVILLLCIGMHLFGHRGHGGHGSGGRRDSADKQPSKAVRTDRHR